MPSTDDRLVQMQFDNAAFEQKVASTIQSLDKLKTSLDFANENKGLDGLSASARHFSLEGIGQAVEGIASRFTAMGAVAFTVISNITNRAVDAGVRLAKSLSLDQVMGGFQEYQVNMNSIQTILANTKDDGANLEDVNSALDKLNEYSDKTIYNFSQMARNIGTFTAAGVSLDDSVNAIKGIANLAAISGSSAEQASTAMYQLSQALAAGKVNLMDWNSVVNAGMGGEVFKKALFETGKALGTITDVPLSASFDEWEAKGGTFREQMQKGWLTADVLKTTLGAFSGDLDVATLKMIGFSDEAANKMIELGSLGQAAATEVKTLTQLVSTVKESVGSGWSATFRIIIGDFEEAKGIFTAFNTAISNIVSDSADKRNKLLQGWKDFGGRNLLIESIVIAFKSLASIINTVKSAFSDVFPPMTSYRLFELTQNLRDFLANLQPTQEQLSNLRHIFVGVFSALSIGWEVVKGVFGVFKDLFSSIQIFSDDSGGALKFFADLGDKINRLRISLVEGGQISSFFETVSYWIRNFVLSIGDAENPLHNLTAMLINIKDTFLNTFGIDAPEKPKLLGDALDKLKEKFGLVRDITDKVKIAWDELKTKVDGVKESLTTAGDNIKTNFENAIGGIEDAFKNADWSKSLDYINTGLLAGIAVMIRNFFHKDFGIQDFFNGINEALSSLTGTLDAMQTKLKAEALLKIAEAIAVLTVSLVVLATIDSEDLSKSLTAMAVGFGELVSAFAILTKISSGPMGSAGVGILAGGMILLGGAILLLSAAAKNLAGLDWNELAKGLTGVTVLLAALTIAAKPLTKMSKDGGLISAGLGMIAIATAMNIMASAVKSFAEMDWESMGKGLLGVAGGLVAVVGAMQFIPENIFGDSLGLVAISIGLNILAKAVKSFAEMDSDKMLKGLLGVGEGLMIIALALQLMPEDVALSGLSILAISFGLTLLAQAVKSFGDMSWKQLATGLAGVAGSLLILAGAAYLMEGAIPGAIAIGIIALSLGKLADGVSKFAKLSWKDLLFGLGALAGTLAVVGLAGLAMSPIIPTLLGLGVALLAVAGAFALFGLGAFLIGEAFSLIAEAGTEGVAVLLEALDGFIIRLPDFISSLATGLVELAGILLQAVIDLAPKVGEALVTLIHTALKAVREVTPDIVATGFEILMALLTGIKDNIGEITTTVVDIITNFLDALSTKVPEIIDSVFNLVVAIIEGVIGKLGDIAQWLLPKGLELLQGLWNGVVQKADEVYIWFTQLPGNISNAIGVLVSYLLQKGKDLLNGLWNGVKEIWEGLRNWFSDLPENILTWLGSLLTTLFSTGKDLLQGLWNGVTYVWELLLSWFGSLKDLILDGIGTVEDVLLWLKDIGKAVIQGFWNGLKEIWTSVSNWIMEKVNAIPDFFLGGLDINSPSRVMRNIGVNTMKGFALGMQDVNLDPVMSEIMSTIVNAMLALNDDVGSLSVSLSDFTPTITPVLDLSNVQNGTNILNSMFSSGQNFSANVSYGQASILSTTTEVSADNQNGSNSQITEIRFEQNNYSPESLSTTDIYRQTRNQLALAKGELANV